MPDLDQLLHDDARDMHAAVPDFDRALTVAHTSTRRRKMVAGGIAAGAALALIGGLAYAGTGNADTHRKGRVHLAAYDHVLGPVTDEPDKIWVFGPADEYTAQCDRIPGETVEKVRLDDGSPGFRVSVQVPASDGYAAATVAWTGEGDYLANSQLFRCPAP